MTMLNSAQRIITFFGTLLLLPLAWGLEPVPTTSAPEIGGYSPVSYFTEQRAELGKAEFAVSHQGRVYYLTSAEQVEVFNTNPDRYQPRYNRCSYSLISGKKMALDPTSFKVVGDTLLLFHQSEGVDGLAAWNNSGLTDSELMSRADKQFVLVRF